MTVIGSVSRARLASSSAARARVWTRSTTNLAMTMA
jgi:hypothetical protein